MKSVEWFTPEYILSCVRAFYGGGIDLDVASCYAANEHVKAAEYYSDSGELKPWHGKVWCNPPYSRGTVLPFVQRAVAHAAKGEALVLLHADSSTKAGAMALAFCSAAVFIDHRVDFIPGEGQSVSKAQCAHMICYFGQQPYSAFALAFMDLGATLKRKGE